MNSAISINTIRFLVLVLVQVLICNHINFVGYINPYIYILFIVLYPTKNNRALFIFLSFLLGLSIDLFSDTGGIHAAASVFIAFVRPLLLRSSFGVQYENYSIKFDNVEFGAKLSYITFLTLIHHIILFYLEIFSISKILLVLEKTLFSSIFTILLCTLITIIFSRKTK